jgi:hypothetical protein
MSLNLGLQRSHEAGDEPFFPDISILREAQIHPDKHGTRVIIDSSPQGFINPLQILDNHGATLCQYAMAIPGTLVMKVKVAVVGMALVHGKSPLG